MKNTRVWLKVTDDEYELPLFVADSARELASMLGLKTDSVKSLAYKGRVGICNATILAVPIEEEIYEIKRTTGSVREHIKDDNKG